LILFFNYLLNFSILIYEYFMMYRYSDWLYIYPWFEIWIKLVGIKLRGLLLLLLV
jgi:hypothetical protein